MDIYAYSQIKHLQNILYENNIVVHRLRGLRLMKDEVLIEEKELQKVIKKEKVAYAVKWLRQRSEVIWCSWKNEKRHKAFIYGIDEDGEKVVINIDLTKVKGKDKKRIKLKWKKIEKAYIEQFDMFNKYVGKNVLYVHARIGGDNRKWYPIDTTHPMYLSDIDDTYDNTYCDIYYDLDRRIKYENGCSSSKDDDF